MNYNSALLALLLLSSTFLSLAQKSEFKQFDDRTGSVVEWLGLSSEESRRLSPNVPDSITVSAFEMSSLITWKQYKTFLADARRMLGNVAYQELLPRLDENHLNECLISNRFDELPVTGVSWKNAKEYCKWRMVIDNAELGHEGALSINYRLPFLKEWTSALYQLEEKGKKHDLNQTYADWTQNSLDESMQFGFDFYYDALASDPPSAKRKMVIGANYLYQFPRIKNYTHSFYQDSCYAHIGFRLIRSIEDETVNLKDCDTYLGDHYAKIWKNSITSTQKQLITLKDCSISYYEENGRLSGSYESYYPNGRLRSKGLYYNNQRLGKWEVWDSLGVKQIERNYVSPYRYTQTFPKLQDEQARVLRDARMIEFDKNIDGYLNYPYVQERAVLWSQRYWARIEDTNNYQLFVRDQLLAALSNGVKDGRIKPYDTNSDEFRDSISMGEFAQRNHGKLIAFELKEDVFYDLDRGLMSTRVIGICPILSDTIDGIVKERKLAWFYFPHIRLVLSKIQCYSQLDILKRTSSNRWEMQSGTSNKTLDDLFFYRDFEEVIIGTTSFRGRTELTPNQSKQEFFRLLETEHDLWLHTNGAN